MIHIGDCREVMAGLDAESIDAIVTDPPYGLEFMGKSWDKLGGGFTETKHDGEWSALHGTTRKGFDGYGVMPNYVTPTANQQCPDCGNWRDGRNPAKPDKRKGYRCVCGGAQREQRRAVAQGMQEWHESWAREAYRVLKPGGHLVAFGGSRTYHRLACAIEDAGFEIRDQLQWIYGQGFPKSHNLPGGLGTSLKPAHEPIVLARKPLIGTVAANVTAHGTGVLNIDGCRIEGGERPYRVGHNGKEIGTLYEGGFGGSHAVGETTQGRWPANVLLDEESGALLDAMSGERKSGSGAKRTHTSDSTFVGIRPPGRDEISYPDTGGASRFFYCAKASRSERNAGLEGMPERNAGVMVGRNADARPNHVGLDGDGTFVRAQNHHPTVKPISLMRWLCRLVTPPGGVILDPFLGSGTTGCAAVLEGMGFVGIEMDPEYAAIAERRIAYWGMQPGLL